ncbi:hypothetical protein BHM03_00029049 [Ensete ventricosum]|nr:hypothetical protein BHM03_00029049 [Ensete ventricosum]
MRHETSRIFGHGAVCCASHGPPGRTTVGGAGVPSSSATAARGTAGDPDAVPDEDVPAGGRPVLRRRDLVERGRLHVRRLAAGRVRLRRPPQILQAQQLLQLRPPAQHLRALPVPADVCLVGGFVFHEFYFSWIFFQGFRKIASDRWEFANECFRRAEKGLLCDIHRRKFSPTAIPSATPVNLVMSSETSGVEQVRSTTSSPGDFQPELAAVAAWASPGSSDGASELAEENSRLRRENKQLSQELGQMKSLCTNIMQLMAKYATWKNGAEATTDVSGGADASPPLEAGGSSGERGSTRLFGVSIGLKRNRGEDGGVASTSAAAMVDDGMVPVLHRATSG